jgi:hypothetical protein
LDTIKAHYNAILRTVEAKLVSANSVSENQRG